MRKRVLAGLLITLLIFVVARKISKNRPSLETWTFDEVKITHTTVYEQVGPGQPEILLNVAPPEQIDAEVRYRAPGDAEFESVALEEVTSGLWSARLPAGEKGDKIEYGFRIAQNEQYDRGGSSTAALESGYHLIKYKGEVSVTVLILHILCMFAAFFFIVEAMIGAVIMTVKGEDRDFTVAQTRWVLLFTFLGGWPLGFALNWQRFGMLWEGFPFGYDITDNKTQLIAVFWLIVAAMSWKSFICRRTGKDMAGDRLFAGTVMTASILSLILYLVPHSL
jgi:hypothetical protein